MARGGQGTSTDSLTNTHRVDKSCLLEGNFFNSLAIDGGRSAWQIKYQMPTTYNCSGKIILANMCIIIFTSKKHFVPSLTIKLADVNLFNPHNNLHYLYFSERHLSSGKFKDQPKLQFCSSKNKNWTHGTWLRSTLLTFSSRCFSKVKQSSWSWDKRSGDKKKRENIKLLNYFIMPFNCIYWKNVWTFILWIRFQFIAWISLQFRRLKNSLLYMKVKFLTIRLM